jgi:hypothetical protein
MQPGLLGALYAACRRPVRRLQILHAHARATPCIRHRHWVCMCTSTWCDMCRRIPSKWTLVLCLRFAAFSIDFKCLPAWGCPEAH